MYVLFIKRNKIYTLNKIHRMKYVLLIFQIYTPKVSKKRATLRRFDDEEEEEENEDIENEYETQKTKLPDGSKMEPNKSSGGKLWSLVSTFLRFASIAPSSDMSMPDIKANDSNASQVIIKRCNSFAGTLYAYV